MLNGEESTAPQTGCHRAIHTPYSLCWSFEPEEYVHRVRIDCNRSKFGLLFRNSGCSCSGSRIKLSVSDSGEPSTATSGAVDVESVDRHVTRSMTPSHFERGIVDETASGHDVGTVELLDDGRVRIEDEGEWKSQDGSGESVRTELPSSRVRRCGYSPRVFSLRPGSVGLDCHRSRVGHVPIDADSNLVVARSGVIDGFVLDDERIAFIQVIVPR